MMDNKILCAQCLGLHSLKLFVEQKGDIQLNCDYCGTSNSKAIATQELCRYMGEVLCTVLVPLMEEYKEDYYMTASGINVYHEAQDFMSAFDTVFPHTFLADFYSYFSINFDLFETPCILYIDILRLEGEGFSPHTDVWAQLVGRLNHQFRFTNNRIAGQIEKVLSPFLLGGELVDAVIYQLRPGEIIYRGREYHSRQEKQVIKHSPHTQLSAPPVSLTSNQRMTPVGISAFYGALEPATCVSELRPHAGKQLAIGKFQTISDLKLFNLDLFATQDIEKHTFLLDPFERNSLEKMESTVFLKELYEELIKPATGESGKNYIVTQLFFEVLRTLFIEQVQGVVYTSVQSGGEGKNVVLFPEYSITRNIYGAVYLPYHQNKELTTHDIHTLNSQNKQPFSDQPVLTYCEGSLSFHRVTSVFAETVTV